MGKPTSSFDITSHHLVEEQYESGTLQQLMTAYFTPKRNRILLKGGKTRVKSALYSIRTATHHESTSYQRRTAYQSIHFRIFFQHQIERERGEEDDRLDIIKVWNPVRSLFFEVRSSLSQANIEKKD